jgi:hypothetical protein
VAVLWLKHFKNTRRDYTGQAGRWKLSLNSFNKTGKMEIRPEFFESAASASSAIPALLASAWFYDHFMALFPFHPK